MAEGFLTDRPKSDYQNYMTEMVNTKSMLQSRNIERLSGTKFFEDNKIRTCSYIKQNGTTFTAVPFYDKRKTIEYPTRSSWTSSMSKDAHKTKNVEHAGMGLGKTLSSYNPNRTRSRMLTPDYVVPIRNSSSLTFGDRSSRDTKHYATTYNNAFKGTSYLGTPSSHPGITAYKNRWIRRQNDK